MNDPPQLKNVFIPMVPPSLNKRLSQHWAIHRKEVYDPWKEAMTLMIGKGKHHNLPREVGIATYRNPKDRKYDDENFRSGCKPIPDILKYLGWIKDDNPDFFKGFYYQRKVGEDETTEVGTRIVIWKTQFPKVVKEWLTTEELMEIIPLGKSTLHKLFRDKEIPAEKYRNKWRVPGDFLKSACKWENEYV